MVRRHLDGDDGGHDAAWLGAGGGPPGAGQRGPAAAATVLGFVVAYGVVWLLAGLAGYACVQAVRALDLGALGWTSAGRYLAAAVVVGAGLYQLTPVKRRWLKRCVARERHLPRPGVAGALRAGAGHGVCCVACCWTLMVALYAHGLMSVTWMVVVTVLIAGERLVAQTATAVATVAAVLVVLGLGIAVAPASVPGLTILPPPGTTPAWHGGEHGHERRRGSPSHLPASAGHLHRTRSFKGDWRCPRWHGLKAYRRARPARWSSSCTGSCAGA